MVEAKFQRMSRTGWLKEFGKALEPTVVMTSALAIVVGFIGGLVAQGLLELIYLFTDIFLSRSGSLRPRGNKLPRYYFARTR
jgi:hypothetical protein